MTHHPVHVLLVSFDDLLTVAPNVSQIVNVAMTKRVLTTNAWTHVLVPADVMLCVELLVIHLNVFVRQDTKATHWINVNQSKVPVLCFTY